MYIIISYNDCQLTCLYYKKRNAVHKKSLPVYFSEDDCIPSLFTMNYMRYDILMSFSAGVILP